MREFLDAAVDSFLIVLLLVLVILVVIQPKCSLNVSLSSKPSVDAP